MLALVAPILVFGLVIFVHELGHFVAAKLVGVYAPRFSIGFGPALFRKRRGETEYVIAALPLGGYVRMASKHDAEAAVLEGGNEDSSALSPDDPGYDPNAMKPFGPKEIPPHRWFESKGLAARLFIMIAGVAMNVVLAYAVYVVMNLRYGEPVLASRVIGAVQPLPSAPGLATLRAGDTIVAVNGAPVKNWNEVQDGISESRGPELRIRTNSGEAVVPVGGAGQPTAREVLRALDVQLPPVIGDVVPGSPAARANLRFGDSVAAIGGVPLRGWSDLLQKVSASPGTPLDFEIIRGGQRISITLKPDSTSVRDGSRKETRILGRIGAYNASASDRESMPIGRALTVAGAQTWAMGGTIVRVVRGLLTREVSPSQLGGVIAITQASVEAAKSGLEQLLGLIAMLSVNVAVLNLLPIPILDGGQILINVAEAAKGQPFSMRTREYILRVGLVVILMIFVLSTFNDLKALLGRLFA